MKAALLIVLAGMAALSAAAQTPFPETGYPVGASFDSHNFDVVNMHDLGVHVGLDVIMRQVRTGKLGLGINIDSNGLLATADCQWDVSGPDDPGSCLGYLVPTAANYGGYVRFSDGSSLSGDGNSSTRNGGSYDLDYCPTQGINIYHHFAYEDPDGTMHQLFPDQECESAIPDFSRRYASDGSGLIMYSNGEGGFTWYDGNGGFLGQLDSNGNKALSEDPASLQTLQTLTIDTLSKGLIQSEPCSVNPTFTATDDSGRAYSATRGDCYTLPSGVPGAYNWNSPGYSFFQSQTFTYVDSNGATQQIKAHYQFKTIAFNICSYTEPDSAFVSSCNGLFPQIALTQVDLPNGRSYKFQYADQNNYPSAPYGELTQITLPTGGTITYDWLPMNYVPWSENIVYGEETVTSWPVNIVISKRTVSDNNGDTYVWHYYLAQGGGSSNAVVDPNGNEIDYAYDNVARIQPVTYTGTGETHGMLGLNPPGANPIASTVTYYSCNRFGISCAGGATAPMIAKQITTGSPGTSNGDISGYPTTVTTTLENGQTSKVVKAYQIYADTVVGVNFSWGNPTDVYEYDFGQGAAGSLLRHTHYDGFLNLSSQDYFSKNLANLFTSKTVYDGSGIQVAKSILAYDGQQNSLGIGAIFPALAQTTAVIGHDYTDYPSSFKIRGNLTTESDWVVGNTWITKQYGYDDTGRLVEAIDGNGNTTTYDYTDKFVNGSPTTGVANSFLTSITKPTTNGVAHIEHFKYYFGTGALAEHDDENVEPTLYHYDAVGALTSVDYPDGGHVGYDYGGYAIPLTISSTTSAAPDPDITSTKIYDGLGRLSSSQVGDAIVDFGYDGIGELDTVSNPHGSSPSPDTDGTTIYTYDALGRRRTLTHPDKSTQQWSYPGNQTIFTDEASNRWTRTSDALGRLTNVTEPGGLQTTYTYNALDNLQHITQTGVTGETARNHSFTYDSLSRLVCAANPENATVGVSCPLSATTPMPAGAISYSYDANGNLLNKTDARGIGINYSYDALNRLTSETYSDGTPSVTYTYDNFTGWGQPHGASIGRLVRSYTCSTPGCNDDLYSYDPMGRINHIEGATPSEAGHASHWMQMAYDLAGNMTDFTYPSGHHIKQTWDGNGHLGSSNLVDINGVSTSGSFLQSASYHPDGSPYVSTLGNGTQQTIEENNRLQIRSLVVSTPLAPFNSQPFLSHTYCYVNCATGGPANNGNIWGITDTLNSSLTQGFTYDSLNRISSFSLGGVLKQQYKIDSFGNMSPMVGTNPVYTFDPATNRINNLPCASSVPSPYDAAGNQTCDTDSNSAIRTYSFDAENHISKITMLGSTTPFETYTYSGDGNRIRKDNANGTYTEYVYFNGQPMGEKDQSGAWTGYVYANGFKIALDLPVDTFFDLSGVNGATTDSNRWTAGVLPIPSNITLQTGDVLNFRIIERNATAGISMDFTDGSNSDWYCGACKMSITANQWVQQSISLNGPMIGKTIEGFLVENYQGAPDGPFEISIADITITHADGTITQIPTPLGSFAYGGDMSMVTNQSFVGKRVGTTTDGHFYLGDHLGTAQMEFSGGYWPVWKGQFAPFGQELDSQVTANNYKFTDKERDSESGLDNFGYRYYSSNMGRWMSPDPTGLDYADLTNPQSFNLYSFVLNNPLKFVDPNGLYCAWEDGTSDDDPSDGGASHGDCDAQGGHWTDQSNPCHGADGCVATFDWNPPTKPCVQQALRAVVAAGETPGEPNNGYGTVVKGTVISAPASTGISPGTKNAQIADPSSLTGHPNILVQVGPGLRSTAFGRYQILSGTAKSYGFNDFSPAGQDAAANTLMDKRGMVTAAMNGNIQQAIQNGGREWASLPGSPYGQPTQSMNSALQTYGSTIVSSGCQ